MVEKKGPALTEQDYKETLSTTTLNVPVSAAPKLDRIDVTKPFSLDDLALAINALRDDVNTFRAELRAYDFDAVHGAADHNVRELSRLIGYIYTSLNLAIPAPEGMRVENAGSNVATLRHSDGTILGKMDERGRLIDVPSGD